MFWALAQRRKWQARLREEGRQEGKEEGREEGKEEGREEGRQEGVAANRKEFEQWLAKVAEERNIPLDELMPPKEGSQC